MNHDKQVVSKPCEICGSVAYTKSIPSTLPKRKPVKLCKGCFDEAKDLEKIFKAK